MQLMPTLLDRCVRADRYDEAEKYGIMNCIECGACTFVCPPSACLRSPAVRAKGDYDPQEGGSREESRGRSCKEGC